MKLSRAVLLAGAIVAFPVLAQQGTATTTTTGNTGVVVGVPPSVIWGDHNAAPREQQVNCMSCCIFDNRQYTEGAVVKTEGILLQCVRDRQTLGTNTLIWQVLKQ